MVIYIAIFLLIIAFDQISKHLITSRFAVGEGMTVIKGIFDFRYIENRGAAFGLLQGARVFFIVLTVVVFLAIIIYLVKAKPKSHLEKTALCFIAGGAIGNFIDRVYLGYVRDFIETTFMDLPIFNIADCFVCIGAGLYILSALPDAFNCKVKTDQ